MSIFPTKILLATDGSREAKLAATTAADLAKSTGSELHVLYVGEAVNPYAEEVGLAGGLRRATSSGKLATYSRRRQKGCGLLAERWRKPT
jgi:nucleotide-binding universal stress UspA family protein